MKLTPDYRRVIAIFDTSIEEGIEYQKVGEDLEFRFQVGPFVYNIQFSPIAHRQEDVEVSFELINIKASDEELVWMFSKLEKREVSLDEAQYKAKDMVYNHSRQLLAIMGPYSMRIFGTVISIIKDYVKKYSPQCIKFTSSDQKRTNIYHNMVKRAFPQANIKLRSLGNVTVKFVVCFI